MKLEIEYMSTADLKPYASNAKIHTAEQVEQIKKSILEFGMNDPIAIWKNNEIIEGHGRLIACSELGIDSVPVIRLDELTDEQRKAYMLVHNKLTMNTGFDVDILNMELENIVEIDMTQYDFELATEVDEDVPVDYRDPSCQHNVFENQERMQFDSDSYYGIPKMEATKTVGDEFLRFMDYNTVDDHKDYIAHFYYDDYKFVSAWREPDKYIEKLREFKAVIAPDFSLYTDFPRALQILSCYRRQWCGAYWQMQGLDVIPDVVWGDEESFKYCFDGIPKHSVVAVSTVGVTRDDNWNNKDGDRFLKGYNEMLKRLKPTKVLFYGTMIDGIDQSNVIRIPSYYEENRGKW